VRKKAALIPRPIQSSLHKAFTKSDHIPQSHLYSDSLFATSDLKVIHRVQRRNRPLLSASGWVAFLFCYCAAAVGAPQSGPPAALTTITATRSSGAIKIDGNLDEEAWRDAGMAAELTQQSPNPGAPSRYKTTVKVLFEAEALYFGFECVDPEPSKIATHTMKRDGDLGGDDTVAIVLDPYGDRRTGYYFRINSAGARVDGLISGLSDPKLDWDGI